MKESVNFSALKAASAEQTLGRTEAKVFKGSGRPLLYRIYKSEACGDGREAKLFVFLHGSGGRGDDNRLQIEDQSAVVNYLVSDSAKELLTGLPYIVIAPQCPEGASWVKTSFEGSSYSLKATPISEDLRSVYELMQSLYESENVKKGDTVLMGMSMGGYGTWDLALRYPDEFKTIVPICGGGDPREAEKLKGTRIWAFHCSGDRAVPVSGSRDMINALKEAGVEAKYTEFARDAHNAWTPAFEEVRDPLLLEWMFE